MPLCQVEALVRDVLETGESIPKRGVQGFLVCALCVSQGGVNYRNGNGSYTYGGAVAAPGVSFSEGDVLREMHCKAMSWIRRAKAAMQGSTGVTIHLFR